MDQVRVATYAFVGEPVLGDRPDRKHTPFMLKILTPDLLKGDSMPDKDDEVEFEYTVSRRPAAGCRTLAAVSLLVSVCLSLCLSACLPVCLSACLSVSLSLCLSVSLSLCLLSVSRAVSRASSVSP